MSRTTFKRLNVLVYGGLICLLTGTVSAEEIIEGDLSETGIVHITDMPAAATFPIQQTKCDQYDSSSCTDTGCNNGQYADCQYGNCQYGDCHPGRPTGYCAGLGCCGYGCSPCASKLSSPICKILAWLDPIGGGCSYSPATGFVPPSKRPYFRYPVAYKHNYPARWVGGVPSGYHGHLPPVYTPTDTTQLGYYYQKVPTWVPGENMIPPAPQIGEWHRYGNADAYAAMPQGASPYCEVQEAPESISEEPSEIEQGNVPPMPTEKIAPAPPANEQSALNPNLLPLYR